MTKQKSQLHVAGTRGSKCAAAKCCSSINWLLWMWILLLPSLIVRIFQSTGERSVFSSRRLPADKPVYRPSLCGVRRGVLKPGVAISCLMGTSWSFFFLSSAIFCSACFISSSILWRWTAASLRLSRLVLKY